MRSPEEVLENLSKQSAKHENDGDYRFTELYKHFLNPLFYESGEAEKALEALKNERWRPEREKALAESIASIANSILNAVFRTAPFNPGCHKMLIFAQSELCGSDQLIAGNLKPSFGNFDPNAIAGFLRRKIADERFIRLVYKLFKAGKADCWSFGGTYSKEPVGAPLSQTLAGICLAEFDRKLAGNIRGDGYVRCASSFLIGLKRGGRDLKCLKGEAARLLESMELLVDATSASMKAKFLSYEASLDQQGRIRLRMPKDLAPARLKELGAVLDLSAKPWKASPAPGLIRKSDEEILDFFSGQVERLYRYCCLAENVSLEMGKFSALMKQSMMKTFAAKYDCSSKRMYEKLRLDDGSIGVIASSDQGIRKFYSSGFVRKPDGIDGADVDLMPDVSAWRQDKGKKIAVKISKRKCGSRN
ncbi:MAG: hypothetical protein LBU32_20330 [Clostridiales bacterium]|nr:hypothetical protein [Clostridiales bacterium]